jgi:hypothetical protein
MKNSGKKLGIFAAIAVVIMLAATLPFHYLWDHSKILMKDNLTLSNTFVTAKDLNKILDRFNEASLLEKEAILRDPWVIKLTKEGIFDFYDSRKEEVTGVEPKSYQTSAEESHTEEVQSSYEDNRVYDYIEPPTVEPVKVEDDNISVSDLIPEQIKTGLEGWEYSSISDGTLFFVEYDKIDDDYFK